MNELTTAQKLLIAEKLAQNLIEENKRLRDALRSIDDWLNPMPLDESDIKAARDEIAAALSAT